jgi:hypothetical protein
MKKLDLFDCGQLCKRKNETQCSNLRNLKVVLAELRQEQKRVMNIPTECLLAAVADKEYSAQLSSGWEKRANREPNIA